jgi:hypothetical protein
LRENRRRSVALPLDSLSRRAKLRQRRTGLCVPTPVSGVVAEAAELLRRRESAEVAWQRVAPPDWLRDATVAGVSAEHKDTATIIVTNSTLLYELRRRQPSLERDLSRQAPGIRRIRFTLGSRPVDKSHGRA